MKGQLIITGHSVVAVLPGEREYHTLITTCPWCGDVADGVVEINGNGMPKPGDTNLCGECGMLSVFDDSLVLHRAPSA